MHKSTLAAGWLLLLSIALSGCQEQPYYEQYQEVAPSGWHKDSVKSFAVEIEDTTATYAVIFNLRANSQYPYSNLYLFRNIGSEAGKEYADTANLTLANAYGEWLGTGVGDLKTFSRPFRAQPLRFNRRGTFRFNFTQAMRRDTLPGVEDVGLTLYKQENGAQEKQEKD